MLKIYINSQPEYIDIDLENEIYDLDKDFVITGNRDYISRTEAEWYNRSKDILTDIDSDTFTGESFRYYPELTRSQRKAILKAYDDFTYCDSLECIVTVANILYPDRKFDTATIRGYCQSDWQEIAYDTAREADIKYLEAYYFGSLTELHIEDDDETVWGYIPDETMWEYERNDTLRKELLSYFGYDEDTPCQIYKGESRTARYVDYELIEGEEEEKQDQQENELLTTCKRIIEAAKDITPEHVNAVRAIFA